MSEHDFSRLGVVGSRNWPSRQFVFGVLESVCRRRSVDVIVSGGQPLGVDGWAEEFADEFKYETSIHLPAHELPLEHDRYRSYDVSNFFARNQLIVDDSTFVLAFCWQGSSGTSDTISRCERDGVPHKVFTENDLEKMTI